MSRGPQRPDRKMMAFHLAGIFRKYVDSGNLEKSFKFLADVANGDGDFQEATLETRMAATKLLHDRLLGKAVETQVVIESGDAAHPLAELTDEELRLEEERLQEEQKRIVEHPPLTLVKKP